MQKFYFVSVSNTAHKKIVGSVSADDEKMVREELNKVGMSILTLSADKPAEWDDSSIFEFEVLTKTSEKFSGEILAADEDEVFSRFIDEFDFTKVSYICKANASEAEKLRAREKGINQLVVRQQRAKEEEEDREMRTLSGGLKTLVKLKSKDEDAAAEKKREEKLRKLSGLDEADSLGEGSQNASVSGDVVVPGGTIDEDGDVHQEGGEDEALEEEKEKEAREQLHYIKEKFIKFFPTFSEKFGKFYFYLTEIIVPPRGKTRMDGWREMKLFLFPPPAKLSTEEEREINQKALSRRKAIFERFWISLEEVVDVLAAVFMAYLAIGVFSLYVEIPRMTSLAEATLRGNNQIPFLAGMFIFIRLLILIREKFTSWSVWRTSLLFTIGLLIIFLAGVNIL